MEPTALQDKPSLVSSAAQEPYLSVVIPAYNEASRLPSTLNKILSYLESREYPYEVLVIDDGSLDKTAQVVEEMASERPHLRLVRNPHRGKGYAVRTGMLLATGRYILYSDADLSTPIEEIEKLLPYLEGAFDIAIGSREGLGAARYDEPAYRHLMGRAFNAIVRVVALPQFDDTQCGFKAFRKEAAHTLFKGVHLYGDSAGDVKGAMVTGFDVEVLYLAQRRGYQIAEVPVQWTNAGGSRMRVTFRHAVRVFYDLLRIPWLHRHDRVVGGQWPVASQAAEVKR